MIISLDNTFYTVDRITDRIPVLGSLTAIIDTVARLSIVPFCTDETISDSKYLSYVVVRTNPWIGGDNSIASKVLNALVQLVPFIRELSMLISDGMPSSDAFNAAVHKIEDGGDFTEISPDLLNDHLFFAAINMDAAMTKRAFLAMGPEVMKSYWFHETYFKDTTYKLSLEELESIPEELHNDDEFVSNLLKKLADSWDLDRLFELPKWILSKIAKSSTASDFDEFIKESAPDGDLRDVPAYNSDIFKDHWIAFWLLSRDLLVLPAFSKDIQNDEELLKAALDEHVKCLDADDFRSDEYRKGANVIKRLLQSTRMIQNGCDLSGPFEVLAKIIKPQIREIYIKAHRIPTSIFTRERDHIEKVNAWYDNLVAEGATPRNESFLMEPVDFKEAGAGE